MNKKHLFWIIHVSVLIIATLILFLTENSRTNSKSTNYYLEIPPDAEGYLESFENEDFSNSYKFTCAELKSQPCLKSGGTFDREDAKIPPHPACTVDYGFRSCEDLASRICLNYGGSYHMSNCVLMLDARGMQTTLRKQMEGGGFNPIYRYPLINVNGKIIVDR